VFDPRSVIEIYYDAHYDLRQVKLARAKAFGRIGADEALQLMGAGHKSAEGIRAAMVSLGIDRGRIRLVYTGDVENGKMKRSVSETHRTVANEFTRDEGGAQKRLRAAVFGGIATERQDEIDAIAASSLELKLGDRVCLAWIRLSADNPGGAYPELDTNFQMLP